MIFFAFPLDECILIGYNNCSVIYVYRMFNTRFVVSFLLFYTKFGFISSVLSAGTLSRRFFVHEALVL